MTQGLHVGSYVRRLIVSEQERARIYEIRAQHAEAEAAHYRKQARLAIKRAEALADGANFPLVTETRNRRQSTKQEEI